MSGPPALRDLRPGGFGAQALVCAECSSTQELAAGYALRGAPEGFTVVSGRQLQGRGRGARPWFSPPGCLMFSVLLRPPGPPAGYGGLALVLAGALATAIRERCGADVRLKWPNDLVLDGRKLGGVLLEGSIAEQRVAYFVFGAGVNVRVDDADFPAELREHAVSLHTACDELVDEEELLPALLEAVEAGYRAFLDRGSRPLVERLAPLLTTTGRRVRVELDREACEGLAVRLTGEGSLVMRADDGMERTFSSAVRLVEL